MTTRYATAMVLLLLFACSKPADPDAPWVRVEHAGLDAAVESARAEQDLPGMAMAVAWRDRHELWVGTSGFADLEAGTAWEPSHGSRIGSVSKLFTSALVYRLVERGELDLDDPIEAWVPGYWDGPTLRHLLGHSSGIASYNYIGDFDHAAAWTPDALVQWAWDLEPQLRFEPGTDWEYSNTNYVLLGMVVEAATGASFEDALDELLVGLDHTRMAPAGDVDPNVVRAYDEAGADISERDDPSVGWAAGGMVSTPEDLAIWTADLFGQDVLSESSHALMVTPQGLTGEGESEYGLGAFVESGDGLTIYGHTGGLGGYLTYAYYLEGDDVALVVMGNQLPTDLRAASTWAWIELL